MLSVHAMKILLEFSSRFFCNLLHVNPTLSTRAWSLASHMELWNDNAHMQMSGRLIINYYKFMVAEFGSFQAIHTCKLL